MDFLKATLKIRNDEVRPVAWAAGFFFCVMCGWYLIRPLREAMGISRDVEDLPYLYLGTLSGTLIATPLFGLLVVRFRRRTFIAIVYRFFMASLLGFVAAMHLLPQAHRLYTGYAFYVWVSIFNMFLVTLFWGFMADGFKFGDSKRIFGLVSVGGSLGAIAGAAITTRIAEWAPVVARTFQEPNTLTGSEWLKHVLTDTQLLVLFANLILAIILFEAAVRCMRQLGRVFDASRRADETTQALTRHAPEPERSGRETDETARALLEYAPNTEHTRRGSDVTGQGGAFAGIGQTLTSPYLLLICVYLFLYTVTSTFLYFFQANIVSTYVAGSAQRVQVFATIDFWVNIFTLAAELFITSRLLTKLGVGITLLIVPLITMLGFVALAVVPGANLQSLLGMQPALATLIIVQVLRRGGWYGIGKPARETLFTVVSREAKYKAKSFIDTFVYRGGDALTASAFTALTGLGFAIPAMAGLAVVLGLCWAVVGIILGNKQRVLAQGGPSKVSGFPIVAP